MEKYILEHTVHSFECDMEGKLRLLTLFNLLQHIADLHAEKLNLGYKFFLEKQMAWVGANYVLHINQRPKWGDEISFQTWPSGTTPVSAIRDFDILGKDGKSLFTATSQWVLIDMNTGRPQPIKRNIENLDSLNERALESNFPAILPPARTNFEKHFYVRYDDIDINKHVNNAIYPVWASEAVPNEFREKHEIKDISISFKKPSFFGDEIIVLTQIDKNETLHQILSLDKTREFARVKIIWEEKS